MPSVPLSLKPWSRPLSVSLVAVPAVWLFNYFTNKVTSFGVEMENSASELVDYFIKQRTKALKG